MYIKDKIRKIQITTSIICGFLVISMIAAIYSGMLTYTYFVRYKDIKIGNKDSAVDLQNEILEIDNQINLFSAEEIPIIENIEISKGVTYGVQEENFSVNTIIKADDNINEGYGIKYGNDFIVWTKNKEKIDEYIESFNTFITTNYPGSKNNLLEVCSIEPCVYSVDNLIEFTELASSINVSLDKSIYSEQIVETKIPVIYIYGSENKLLKEGRNNVIKEIYETKIHNGTELSTEKISEEIIDAGAADIYMTTDKSKLTYDYTEELSYFTDKQTDFINTILPTLIEGQKTHHIPVSLGLGQAILESGWGAYHINNNIYGIKAGSGYKSYGSFIECVEDYVNIISTREYYKKVLTATNYIEACQYIGESGYAGSSDYGEKVRNIIEKYGLYRWDNL